MICRISGLGDGERRRSLRFVADFASVGAFFSTRLGSEVCFAGEAFIPVDVTVCVSGFERVQRRIPELAPRTAESISTPSTAQHGAHQEEKEQRTKED